MPDETAIMIYTGEQAIDTPRRYADDLAQAGRAADAAAHEDAFESYHIKKSANTIIAQQQALQVFSTYLAQAGAYRSADDLFYDAEAWRGMSEGLVIGFRRWLVNAGYRISSINHQLSIVRQYCTLARKANQIPEETYKLIMTVKGFSAKEGVNIDRERTTEGKQTSKSNKKALPALVLTSQALQLKTETTRPQKPFTREHDKQLEARDALLMGLLIENALRVSEVAGLNIEHINRRKRTVTVYRSKTNDTQTHNLYKHTYLAAERYIKMLGRKSGPLFVGYEGKRITRQGIFDRVRQLGEQVGIENLSPHDLRHFWTADAMQNGTPLNRIQEAGNWTTSAMVMRYAKLHGIANEGVIITE